jgi:large subunit ribosomal protein L21
MKLAIIKTGGKQYVIKEGDKLKLEKIIAKEGDNVSTKGGSASGGEFDFNEVLLVADKDNIKIGAPLVEGAKVSAKVLKQGRSKKVVVFHYHSKTRYKKKAGHRQHFTEVEILGIK